MTLLAIHIIILGMRDAAPPEKSLSLTPGAMLAPYILVAPGIPYLSFFLPLTIITINNNDLKCKCKRLSGHSLFLKTTSQAPSMRTSHRSTQYPNSCSTPLICLSSCVSQLSFTYSLLELLNFCHISSFESSFLHFGILTWTTEIPDDMNKSAQNHTI